MRGRAVLIGLGGLALLVWCGGASGYHRDSSAAAVSWLVSLGLVVVIDVSFWRGRTGRNARWRLEPARHAWPRPGRGGAASAFAGTAPWLALAVVAAAWDALGIDTGTHEAHLTISALAQAYRPLNAVLLLVWILTGIGYGAARARSPVETTAPPNGRGGRPAYGVGATFVPHAARPALLLPSSRPLGVVFWLAVLAAGVVIDIVARRSNGRMATAGELVRFVSTSRVANVIVIAAWTFAGYHLFAR